MRLGRGQAGGRLSWAMRDDGALLRVRLSRTSASYEKVHRWRSKVTQWYGSQVREDTQGQRHHVSIQETRHCMLCIQFRVDAFDSFQIVTC